MSPRGLTSSAENNGPASAIVTHPLCPGFNLCRARERAVWLLAFRRTSGACSVSVGEVPNSFCIQVHIARFSCLKAAHLLIGERKHSGLRTGRAFEVRPQVGGL